MPENHISKIKRRLSGVVVSAATPKTRIVLVERVFKHPKYIKRIRSTRRFAAHDEKNFYQVGDKVIIEQTRPLSRTKKWRIAAKLT